MPAVSAPCLAQASRSTSRSRATGALSATPPTAAPSRSKALVSLDCRRRRVGSRAARRSVARSPRRLAASGAAGQRAAGGARRRRDRHECGGPSAGAGALGGRLDYAGDGQEADRAAVWAT